LHPLAFNFAREIIISRKSVNNPFPEKLRVHRNSTRNVQNPFVGNCGPTHPVRVRRIVTTNCMGMKDIYYNISFVGHPRAQNGTI
jgi:hypothetical protein